ncbi:hypothetical protein [Paraburkholderia pallida]|uniref:Uncharacterized protein n=1 Tax=Paraburkholderia pallida TaxID=2547399 RepID=A0A4P7D8C7_9BURK|nr:hypothetical protein [Paraburkholderia pallida]QBR03074.1 hypothetical protein E1956_38520 [Paraburkholderia pallida]
MKPEQRYQLNVCRGDLRHVRECFREWKGEPLVYRQNQLMFEGRDEVRPLSLNIYENAERARKALQNACSPQDTYALAAEVNDGESDRWIVMAAYSE